MYHAFVIFYYKIRVSVHVYSESIGLLSKTRSQGVFTITGRANTDQFSAVSAESRMSATPAFCHPNLQSTDAAALINGSFFGSNLVQRWFTGTKMAPVRKNGGAPSWGSISIHKKQNSHKAF